MGSQGDVELRIIRSLATLGFFAAVTLASVTLAGAWGYVIGAVLFGGMTVFLWRDDLAARATERTHLQAEENARRHAERQASLPPAPGSPASWS